MLIGAAVLAHGDFAYDPSLLSNYPGKSKKVAAALHSASIQIGGVIEDLLPDVIILVTPHGISHQRDLLIYNGVKASGLSELGQDLPNCDVKYNVEIEKPIASEFSSSLSKYLSSISPNVSLLTTFGNSYPTPLNWGEVIPLSFLKFSKIPTAFLSLPHRRLTETISMIPEMLDLGNHLRTFIEQSNTKVFLVISGDLAHTHTTSSPYGFSSSASFYDEAIFRWCRTLNTDALLMQAGQHVSSALSCGYLGFVLLEGALAVDRTSWTPSLLAGGHPTYYGMAVASFLPKDESHAITDFIPPEVMPSPSPSTGLLKRGKSWIHDSTDAGKSVSPKSDTSNPVTPPVKQIDNTRNFYQLSPDSTVSPSKPEVNGNKEAQPPKLVPERCSIESIRQRPRYTAKDLLVASPIIVPLSSLLFPGPYPEGVDPANRERHLTREEFRQLFGMTLEEFEKEPKWKQISKKKQLRLF